MAVGLVSISFFFGALILAYYFSIQSQTVWQRFQFPRLLWFSTGALILSSWMLETGRYALRRAVVTDYRNRVLAALAFAAIFLSGQAFAAAQLLAEGVAAPGNPHGSVFYVFMGLHGAHVFAGMMGLSYLYYKSGRLYSGTESHLRKHRMVASTVAMYWHFMGALWLVLFLMLELWTHA
jgi:cytochrome c oxidase subunit 3